MKCGVPPIVVLVIHVGVFGVILRDTGATASTACILSRSAGNLTIDNHARLTSAPGAGPLLQPRTIVPFPNISFYSSCSLVQIDIIADGLGSLCSPNLAILEEFPGKKYQTASKLIPPSTHVGGIATWTAVPLDGYISDNSSVTKAYILGIAVQANCQLNSKVISSEFAFVLLQGTAPRVLQKFSFGAGLEPRVTLTIRALDACHHAACDTCQTLYRSCPALAGASGTSQHQYYCSSASNYTCPTSTVLQPTNRTMHPTTSPQQNTSVAVTATTVVVATSYTLKYNSSGEVSTQTTATDVTQLTNSTTQPTASPQQNTSVAVTATSVDVATSYKQKYNSPGETSSPHPSPLTGTSKPDSSAPVSQITTTSADVAILYVSGPSTSVILAIGVPLIILALCLLLVLLYRRKKRNSLAEADQSRLGHLESENGLMLPRPSSYAAHPQASSGAAQNPSKTVYYDIALEPVKASNSMRISRSSAIADAENQRPDDADVPMASLNSEHHLAPLYSEPDAPADANARAQGCHYTLPSTGTQSRANRYESLGPHSNALPGGTSPTKNGANNAGNTPVSSSFTHDNTRHQVYENVSTELSGAVKL
ncbi:mucin-5AC-like [Sycon ciliatum]|uniref:mucin-5AC-like n=1 Tax=Sycon ciliatum TaxID=27933 RepID=UPI0031F6AF32